MNTIQNACTTVKHNTTLQFNKIHKYNCVLRSSTQNTVAPFFIELFAVFQKFLKGENVLLLQAKQLLVFFIRQLFEEK